MVRVRVGGVEFGGLLLLVFRECCIAFSTSADIMFITMFDRFYLF